ncbi:MAG: isoaspartyl peptidase/L-asparaginase family protein [Candidatus Odinarchaeia archaeon]
MRCAIIVHGGARLNINKNEKMLINGVIEAASRGFDALKKGESSLNAVEEAVKTLEDNPLFNAGTGASLNILGNIQMDACIMDGKTLNAGATALIEKVRHPVSLARIIMENTDHVFIAGEFAERLARKFNLEFKDLRTEDSVKAWRELCKNVLKHKHKIASEIEKLNLFETVGAVAIDSEGNLAAATSTGGLMCKLPNRIGDTPVVGAGTYADNNSGAVSITGVGEVAIRLCLAKTICDMSKNGLSASEAVKKGLELVKEKQYNLPIGCILINKDGELAVNHNTKFMPCAYQTSEMTMAKGAVSFTQLKLEK